VKFSDPALHLDGKAPLGRAAGEGTCWACHGTEQSVGAPGPDLEGNSETTTVTVGLHQVHLTDGDFHKAFACTTCHPVPAQLLDAGHIDSDRPAEVVFSDLASGKVRGGEIDLQPGWDRAAATCSNVYCHALDGGDKAQWRWTEASDLNCSSCHGFPPQQTLSGGAHVAGTDCASCHAAAFDQGVLDPAKHVDGKVDLL
jgi:predicted CxxxxCH...CXXCH cytochrome family protein